LGCNHIISQAAKEIKTAAKAPAQASEEQAATLRAQVGFWLKIACALSWMRA
jgi:hypothetical protein